MKITFRINEEDWFLSQVHGDNYTVSMTANIMGFTPSNGMIDSVQYRKWPRKEIRNIEDSCNELQEVMIFDYISPSLLLVPKTRGKSDTKSLMRSLLEAVDYMGVEYLHFRHYEGLLREFTAIEEVTEIFNCFLNPNLETSLKEVLIDVGDKKIIDIYNEIIKKSN
jgi:hypothetical protein